MAYEYTVTTPHGDVNLTTEHHHGRFQSVEEFLRAHEKSISQAVNVGQLAVSALGLFLMHGRRGARLK